LSKSQYKQFSYHGVGVARLVEAQKVSVQLRVVTPVMSGHIPWKEIKCKMLDWEAYFISIANQVATRSSCGRRQVGAVMVKERQILATGYNGTPRGLTNCNQGGCPRFETGGQTPISESYCVHAEENAILQCARSGQSCRDSTIYCTHAPCLMCAKMIINAGIASVVYEEEYLDTEEAISLLRAAQIGIRQHTPS
jgi:dCMP deaminase